MTDELFQWRQLDRKTLLSALSNSDEFTQFVGASVIETPRKAAVPNDSVVAAFTKAADRTHPRLAGLYINESNSRDLFAWISTYLPSVCPITQTCRIQPISDSGLFDRDLRHGATLVRGGAWAGAIVGECLAQLGHEAEVATVPLSAALATFSLPVARFQALWGRKGEVSEILRRLQLASAGNGVERRLPMQRLEIVWRVLRALESESSVISKLSPVERAIVQACSAVATSTSPGAELASALGLNVPVSTAFARINELTAEERLTIFDKVLDSYLAAPPDPLSRDLKAFAVSLAAWAVGLGDAKHIRLLWPAAKEIPIVLVWFGLLIGLHPTGSGLGDFGSLVRLVERELTYSFSADDPPRADIGILEYLVYQEREFGNLLKNLRRAQARALSIELMPGVVFAKAFGAEQARAPSTQPPDGGVYVGKDVLLNLDRAFAELWNVRNVLVHSAEEQPKTQSDLFPSGSASERATKKRKKRGGGE